MHFLKNDIEFVDDFPNCKEVFYFGFFIQDQFSFAFAFDGITFLRRFRIIIYIETVVYTSSINDEFLTEIMKLLVSK